MHVAGQQLNTAVMAYKSERFRFRLWDVVCFPRLCNLRPGSGLGSELDAVLGSSRSLAVPHARVFRSGLLIPWLTLHQVPQKRVVGCRQWPGCELRLNPLLVHVIGLRDSEAVSQPLAHTWVVALVEGKTLAM